MINPNFASQIKKMSYGESNERRRSRSAFRIGSDLLMGPFFVVIGVLVIIAKSFGRFELPAVVAYVLGAMMAVGGSFRFWRGLKEVLPKKNED